MTPSSPRRRWFQTVFTAYTAAALTATALLAAYALARPDAAALDAEHLETNERGALFRITDVHGDDGRPLAWDELEASLRFSPLMDTDGVVQAQDVFFVYAVRPGTTHVITLAHDGHVLWRGAFDAEGPGLLDVLPPIPPVPSGESEPSVAEPALRARLLWPHQGARAS